MIAEKVLITGGVLNLAYGVLLGYACRLRVAPSALFDCYRRPDAKIAGGHCQADGLLALLLVAMSSA
jgi:hypothetical protein